MIGHLEGASSLDSLPHDARSANRHLCVIVSSRDLSRQSPVKASTPGIGGLLPAVPIVDRGSLDAELLVTTAQDFGGEPRWSDPVRLALVGARRQGRCCQQFQHRLDRQDGYLPLAGPARVGQQLSTAMTQQRSRFHRKPIMVEERLMVLSIVFPSEVGRWLHEFAGAPPAGQG